jgi:twitching motility protein PilU
VADLIFKGEVHGLKESMAKSKEAGMQTFDQALFDLYEAGEVSYEDAMRNADSVSEFKLNVKLNSKRRAGEDGRPKMELSLQGTAEDKETDKPAEFQTSAAAPVQAAPSASATPPKTTAAGR